MLRPILEVCGRETGYEGRGRRREPWWRQTEARTQLSAKLKDLLAASRERLCKFGRRSGGGGEMDVEESEDGVGGNGSWYAGTETGDSQVVE